MNTTRPHTESAPPALPGVRHHHAGLKEEEAGGIPDAAPLESLALPWAMGPGTLSVPALPATSVINFSIVLPPFPLTLRLTVLYTEPFGAYVSKYTYLPPD